MNHQDTTLQDILTQYIEDVLAKLPISDVTDVQRELMRELIVSRVDKRILALIVQELPEDEFQKILGSVEGKELSDDQEMEVIVSAIDHIPEFGDKLGVALEALRAELTEDLTDLKNSSTD